MRRVPTAVSTIALTAALASSALGQLIRPDSATATSEFNGSYLVSNAINGSGLAANLIPGSEHATYEGGNHWTTQHGDTLGESATFTFNAAQTLGAFHMWNHRSNGVASNSNYEVTLYDLVFYGGANGTGATLATLTNLPALPDVASAQTTPFPVVAGVRSVKFVVRATQNGNVSPYTGLAEVAFGPCVPVEVPLAGQPDSVGVCPSDAASFVVLPYGSGPFMVHWQWRSHDGGAWVDVVEGTNPAAGTPVFTAVGAMSQGLVAFPAGSWSTGDRIWMRAHVTNSCGETDSRPVRIAVDASDVGSVGGTPGRDGVHDNNDFVVFIDYFFNANPLADLGSTGGVFGADGTLDNNDFVAFIDEFFTAC